MALFIVETGLILLMHEHTDLMGSCLMLIKQVKQLLLFPGSAQFLCSAQHNGWLQPLYQHAIMKTKEAEVIRKHFF